MTMKTTVFKPGDLCMYINNRHRRGLISITQKSSTYQKVDTTQIWKSKNFESRSYITGRIKENQAIMIIAAEHVHSYIVYCVITPENIGWISVWVN